MPKGDIIFIPFPFTDQSGSKPRPALVLGQVGQDVTVCAITSQMNHRQLYDIAIQPTNLNGLKKPSLVRVSKIMTIHSKLISGVLGGLDAFEIALIELSLKQYLQIP